MNNLRELKQGYQVVEEVDYGDVEVRILAYMEELRNETPAQRKEKEDFFYGKFENISAGKSVTGRMLSQPAGWYGDMRPKNFVKDAFWARWFNKPKKANFHAMPKPPGIFEPGPYSKALRELIIDMGVRQPTFKAVKPPVIVGFEGGVPVWSDGITRTKGQAHELFTQPNPLDHDAGCGCGGH